MLTLAHPTYAPQCKVLHSLSVCCAPICIQHLTPSPTLLSPLSHHYLLPSLLVPPLWEQACSVPVGSASLPLSSDVTPYTFPLHPVTLLSTLTICMASPSLHIGSLTQACQILCIPPACIPIAPPCVGNCCSRTLWLCQYYSVGGPLFSQSCHYLILCLLVPPVWERAHSVAVGSALLLLSSDVIPYTFPLHPVASRHPQLSPCAWPCPLVPPVWERACSVAVGSASLPLSGDVTLHTFPSCPITTCSHPCWFCMSWTVLAPLLTCWECFVATF